MLFIVVFVFLLRFQKTHKLSLFTILLRGFGDVGLLSPKPSISQDRP